MNVKKKMYTVFCFDFIFFRFDFVKAFQKQLQE